MRFGCPTFTGWLIEVSIICSLPTCRLNTVGGRGNRNFHLPQQQVYAVPMVNLHLWEMKRNLPGGARGNFCLLPALLICTKANPQKHPQKLLQAGCGLFSCPWQPENLSPFGDASAAVQLLAGCFQGRSWGRGKSRLRVRHVGGRGALSQET